MSKNIKKISKHIDITATKLSSAERSIKIIQTKLKNIDSDLMDKRWTGYSNEKCQDINKLLQKYNKSLESLIVRISETVKQLEKNAQSFDSKANKI
ncbi:MAG TPA: hypothetical protein GX731_07500 [Clostridiales bacterium]|nr:hypothetical protein [Clostridiales bacterium]